LQSGFSKVKVFIWQESKSQKQLKMTKTAFRKIALLGATGSIGKQTLDLIRSAPEKYQLTSLSAAGNNLEELAKIINEFQPSLVSVNSVESAQKLNELLAIKKSQTQTNQNKTEILHGLDGLNQVATHSEADTTLVAVVGSVGLEPTIEAIKKSKRLIVANKETLVAAGELINQLLIKHQTTLLPADSEHVAIHQCLKGCKASQVRNIYLTASGGPFLNSNINLEDITVKMALNHPTWNMGAKITIDCATLMNKGLEVIEAESLFNLGYDKIQALIHPQSIIHGLVEFIDGNVMAQLGPNDMRLPIQYALDEPEREANLSGKFLDFKTIKKLEFDEPDIKRFPCFRLAYEAGQKGNTYPAVLGAADEIAVELFLQEKIKFNEIPKIIEETLSVHSPSKADSLATIRDADEWARNKAKEIASKQKQVLV
jgi:1-deoxy-D-xylulose-5-phosphate reductoisomerase